MVDDRDAVRAALNEAGLQPHRGRGLRFTDPWGNAFEIVEYGDVQFTKAPEVLRGMGLTGSPRRRSARASWPRRGCSSVVLRHRLEPAHEQLQAELEALVGLARDELVGERDERRELVGRERAEVLGELLRVGPLVSGCPQALLEREAAHEEREHVGGEGDHSRRQPGGAGSARLRSITGIE